MTFDRAWHTFVDEESAGRAPAELEARVQQAIAADRTRPQPHGPRTIGALVTAASVGIAVVWSLSAPKPASTTVAPDLRDAGSRTFVTYSASARPQPPLVTRARAKSARAGGEAVAPAARMSSTAAPEETFQLVRLRLPRQALATLGFILIDPEATGVVDIDVLVGEDGLARQIRKVWFQP